MEPADLALIEAWNLFLKDHTDEVEARFDELMPTLIAAGYASTEPWGDDPANYLWRFTVKGVARAEALVPED